MKKKIVSPFEFALTELFDPEAAKAMRVETNAEREDRIYKKVRNFCKRIKTK